MNLSQLKAAIRNIPDFPKPGIIFRDITPVLSNPELLQFAVTTLIEPYKNQAIKYVAGIEARGFILGVAAACQLGVGFIPIRKKGKLPFLTHEESYALEYGNATLAIHVDALKQGDKVLLIDDLLATGGTADAAARLINKLGGDLVGIEFLLELPALKGREKLTNAPVRAMVPFDDD